MKKLLFLFLLSLFQPFSATLCQKLKVLHMSFHMGCIKDIEDVAHALNLDVTSWHIFSYPIDYLDGISRGFDIYNITHEKADAIWRKHQKYFDQFDVIITSDTPPLARPFLQNDFKKPLIIWLCNRFDYDHGAHGEFPDPELYKLFNEAAHKKNIALIGYTDFEHMYAQQKGVDIGTHVIKPLGSIETDRRFKDTKSSVPSTIDKQKTLFLYPQINSEQQRVIENFCKQLELPFYSGNYNGPNDLTDFKGIIYIPYQTSNLILFEGLHRGFVFFVPSKKFLHELIDQGDVRVCCYFKPESFLSDFINAMEWYAAEHKNLFVYFDSWQDLKNKIANSDYELIRKGMKLFGAFHRHVTLHQWRKVFNNLMR